MDPHRPRNSRSNGLPSAKLLRGRQRLFTQLERWPPLSEFHMAYLHWIPREGQNGKLVLLWRTIGPIRCWIDTFGEEKSIFLPWHCTGSHLHYHHDQYDQVGQRTAASCTVFAKFQKLKIYSPDRPPENVISELKKLEYRLDQVYEYKSSQCWEKISIFFSKPLS